jgi:hypothetical protein
VSGTSPHKHPRAHGNGKDGSKRPGSYGSALYPPMVPMPTALRRRRYRRPGPRDDGPRATSVRSSIEGRARKRFRPDAGEGSWKMGDRDVLLGPASDRGIGSIVRTTQRRGGPPTPWSPCSMRTQRTRLADHLTYSQKRRRPQGEERTRACRASAYEGVPQPPRPAGPPAAGALLSCKPEHKRKGHSDRRTTSTPGMAAAAAKTSQKGPPHTPRPIPG